MSTKRSLFERRANSIYPQQADKDAQEEMAKLAKAEKRTSPQGPGLLDDFKRGAVSPLDGRAR